jgi:hypothetical protein
VTAKFCQFVDKIFLTHYSHLLHGRVIVGGIRRFQFDCDHCAADPLDEFCDRLGVVGPGELHDQYLSFRQRRVIAQGTCCAFEQPDRKQMIVAIISDKAVVLYCPKNLHRTLLSQQPGK